MKKLYMALAALVCLAALKAAPASANQQEGMYAGAFVGANFIQFSKKKHRPKVEFDTGVAVAGFGGYRFCGGFRLEAEVAYRYNKIRKIKFHDFSISDSSGSGRRHRNRGNLNQWTGMVNALYDIPVGWDCCSNSIVPYVGVGIGYSHQEYKSGSNRRHEEHRHRRNTKENGFAWQVLAGLTYVIDCHFDASLEYRFLKGRATHIYNHAIGVTGKYHF